MSLEESLLELGKGWGGVFTWRQAKARHVTAQALARKVRSGFLTRPHRGVYVVEWLRTPDTTYCAALSAAKGSVLSRQSAAHALGFPLSDEGRTHLTIEKGAHRRLAGVSIHETRSLFGADRALARGMPVTSAARTLFDLASVLRPARYQFVLDSQLEADSPSVGEFLACFARQARRGVPGVAAIRRQIPDLSAGDPASASELERRLDVALRSVGLALRRQYRVPWYDGRRGLVDFADPESRTIVEADGLRWHATRQTMADDRRRDRVALAHGWIVIRVTWDELVHTPSEVAEEIRALVLSRRCDMAA